MTRRSKSSGRWLQEHFSDPYVQRAKDAGLRSRAAFKLEEIDAAEKLVVPGRRGRRPRRRAGRLEPVRGAQARGQRVASLRSTCCRWTPSPASTFLQGDFREQAVLDALLGELGGGRVDLVLSDMAPNISGVDVVDQARAADLAALALDFARRVLGPDGALVMKVSRAPDSRSSWPSPAAVRTVQHAQTKASQAAQFRDLFGGEGTASGVR